MACKDRIMDRLRINKPGPAYCNSQSGRRMSTSTSSQRNLRCRSKQEDGPNFVHLVTNQTRNEALDLTVYAHAALWILQKIIDPRVNYGNLESISEMVWKSETTERPVAGRRIRSHGVNLDTYYN